VVIFAPFKEEFTRGFPLLYRQGENERPILDFGIRVELGFGVIEFLLCFFALDTPFLSREAGEISHSYSVGVTVYDLTKKKCIPFYLIVVPFYLKNNLFVLFNNLFALIPVLVVLVATYLLDWYLYRRTLEIIVE
jgi:hypothetical protein